MHLSVILPAYNEEKRIVKTLEDIGRYFADKTYEYEIIVVNNNSKDNMVGVVEELAQRIPHIKIINQPKQGKGYAVVLGMLTATGEYRVFMDADNSTTIDHVDRMMPYFKQGYEVVIASLAVKGSHVVAGGAEPWYRQIAGKGGNLIIQVLAVWGISDTQRGFKMFTARAVQTIFPKLTIMGWGFDVEVLALARKFHYAIKEVPITWNNDPNSKVGIKTYFQVLKETFQVFWNLHTGVYNR